MPNIFGSSLNQAPLNSMLGNLAFQDKAFVSVDNIGIGTTATDTGTIGQSLQNYGGAFISGNLGVGTTNPTSTLQVVGNSSISGIVTVTSIGIGTVSATTAGNITTVNVSTGSFSLVTLSSSVGVATLNIINPYSGQNIKLYVQSPSAAGNRVVNLQVGGTNIPSTGISSGSVIANGGTWTAGSNYLVDMMFIGGTAAANAYGIIR